MCLSTPSIPPPPPPPQDAKPADSMATRRNARKAGGPLGTVLTGATGVTAGSMNTGGNTLLGG